MIDVTAAFVGAKIELCCRWTRRFGQFKIRLNAVVLCVRMRCCCVVQCRSAVLLIAPQIAGGRLLYHIIRLFGGPEQPAPFLSTTGRQFKLQYHESQEVNRVTTETPNQFNPVKNKRLSDGNFLGCCYKGRQVERV